MSDREEKLYSWIKFFVSFCTIIILFITLCFCCFYPFGKTENYGDYIWLSPIIKLTCYSITILSITFICHFLISFGIKINHDDLSYKKAIEALRHKPDYTETKNVNLTIKEEGSTKTS